MEEKYAINQRVRDIMSHFKFGDNVDGFYKKYIGEENSERLRLVFKDKFPIKLEFLLEITKNIAEKEDRKVNGHWLLTGEGQMFLDEKGTAATNNEAAAFKKEAEKFRRAAEALARVNLINAQTITELTGGEVIE
jgi:hypothetical protein